MTSYRSDIDGLRALAVLSVVLFHASIDGFGGGYVGVDVFFVISGYLITGIIDADIKQGRFSLLKFYERRARRILPAMLATIGGSLIVGAFIALPEQFTLLAKSARSAALFYSNIHFWSTHDYFEPAAEFQPLLHTWSLAVEEQFYIFYPLLLLVLARWNTSARTAILIFLFTLSMASSVWAMKHAEVDAFFLTPYRFWELLLGGLLTRLVSQLRMTGAQREILAIAGLLSIAIPVATYSKLTLFPGLTAVPPCIGTAILIVTGATGETMVRRLLSMRPLVFIGLISYSLYLWHWPILAFLRLYYAQLDLGVETGLLAIAVSVILAYLSWRFIENPFRKRNVLSRNRLFATAATAMAILVLAGGLVTQQSGFPSRFSEPVNRFANAANDVDLQGLSCLAHFPQSGFCQFGTASGTRHDFVVWGDSHAGALLPAFDAAAQLTGTSGLFAGGNSCPPLIGVRVDGGHFGEECRKYNDDVLQALKFNGLGIERVFLVARWSLLANGTCVPGEHCPIMILADDEAEATGPAGNAAIFERGLRRTIEALLAIDMAVIFVESTPEIGWNVPLGLAAAEAWGRPVPAAPTVEQYALRNQVVAKALENLRATLAFQTFPVGSLLCQADCKLLHEGRPIYIDDDHISAHGATRLIAPGLVRLIRSMQ